MKALNVALLSGGHGMATDHRTAGKKKVSQGEVIARAEPWGKAVVHPAVELRDVLARFVSDVQTLNFGERAAEVLESMGEFEEQHSDAIMAARDAIAEMDEAMRQVAAEVKADADAKAAAEAADQVRSGKSASGPARLSAELRRVAAAIDASKSPDRALVERDLRRILAAVGS
jgi:hypothetical protein